MLCSSSCWTISPNFISLSKYGNKLQFFQCFPFFTTKQHFHSTKSVQDRISKILEGNCCCHKIMQHIMKILHPSCTVCCFFKQSICKEVTTAQVCSMLQRACYMSRYLHRSTTLGQQLNSLPAVLWSEVVNGGENNSQKIFITQYLCSRFWSNLEDTFNFIFCITQ